MGAGWLCCCLNAVDVKGSGVIVLSNWWIVVTAVAASMVYHILYDQTNAVKATLLKQQQATAGVTREVAASRSLQQPLLTEAVVSSSAGPVGVGVLEPAGGEEQELSFSDVMRHSSPSDCWVVINDVVYDVTAFVDAHPGGAQTLSNEGGSDATSESIHSIIQQPYTACTPCLRGQSAPILSRQLLQLCLS